MKHLFAAFLMLISTASYGNELQDPKVSDGLSAKEVQTVIRENLNKVRHCYEQVLEKSPKAKGKVTVDFTIVADGKVGSSKIANDTVGSKEMGDCILKSVNQWKFPKPQSGKTVDVSYPFQFDPI